MHLPGMVAIWSGGREGIAFGDAGETSMRGASNACGGDDGGEELLAVLSCNIAQYKLFTGFYDRMERPKVSALQVGEEEGGFFGGGLPWNS